MGIDERALQELLDREAIRRCIVRISRGQDRQDDALLAECFHPDAADDHGDFIGPATDFIQYAKGVHRAYWRYTAHGVLNHTIELEGDTAHSETQFIVFLLKQEGGAANLATGRYLDRFERREDGVWRIAARVTSLAWTGKVDPDPDLSVPPDLFISGTWDTTDISYERPLNVERPFKSWEPPAAS